MICNKCGEETPQGEFCIHCNQKLKYREMKNVRVEKELFHAELPINPIPVAPATVTQINPQIEKELRARIGNIYQIGEKNEKKIKTLYHVLIGFGVIIVLLAALVMLLIFQTRKLQAGVLSMQEMISVLSGEIADMETEIDGLPEKLATPEPVFTPEPTATPTPEPTATPVPTLNPKPQFMGKTDNWDVGENDVDEGEDTKKPITPNGGTGGSEDSSSNDGSGNGSGEDSSGNGESGNVGSEDSGSSGEDNSSNG